MTKIPLPSRRSQISFNIKFIYFWLYWVFIAACGLSLVAACGACSLVPGCGLLIAVAPLAMGHGPGVLELRLTICGTWVWLPHSM